MHRSVSALALAALAGCTSVYNQPARITPQIVQSYAAICAKPGAQLTPAGYVAAGIGLVDRECTAFFDNIVLLQKSSRYASKSMTTIGTQTAIILEALEQSATTLAIVAAASEVVVKLIDGFAAEYAFSPYAANVRGIVFSAMEQYKTTPTFMNAMVTLEFRESSPDAYCFAQSMIQNYAKICTIASIEAFAQQAITKSGAERVLPKDTAATHLAATFATPSSGGLYQALQMPNFEAGPASR
jgi:hypothetical protein